MIKFNYIMIKYYFCYLILAKKKKKHSKRQICEVFRILGGTLYINAKYSGYSFRKYSKYYLKRILPKPADNPNNNISSQLFAVPDNAGTPVGFGPYGPNKSLNTPPAPETRFGGSTDTGVYSPGTRVNVAGGADGT